MSLIERKRLVGITSASIEKYLLLTGWNRVGNLGNKISVFSDKEDDTFRLAVPASDSVSDFYERVSDLVHTLSAYSEKTEQSIIDSLKSAFTDRIQFRIITEDSKEGKLPLDYASRCLEGMKDLILYAACAEENAKPICVRTYNSAKANLDNFRFEQTELGSFIFSIGVQVANEDFEQMYLDEIAPPPEEPPAHKIVKRIETAIQQIDNAVNRQVTLSELVENAYVDGITANMCDAIAKLRPDGDGDMLLETSIHYAEAITRTVQPPKVCTFDSIHFAVATEISNRYKDCTLIEDVTLSGTIRMLSKSGSSAEDESENKVRLLTKYEGKQRGVDLTLSSANHKVACDAYRDDKEVSVTGTLDKSGKYWFFSQVTGFEVTE